MLESLVESLPTSTAASSGQLSSGIPAWLGQQDLLHPTAARSTAARERRGIAQAQFGERPRASALKQLLIERTEGNPFFLEESVRTLVETKVLAGERGNYHLAKSVESTQVPATVQAVLAARIDRLPPEEKQLLQSAAVIGKDVPFVSAPGHRGIIGRGTPSRPYSPPERRSFFTRRSLFPDLEYTFKHALTHEVAYGSVFTSAGARCTRESWKPSRRLYSDRLVEQVELLAHHAFRGELWEKAVDLPASGRRQGGEPLGASRSGSILRAGAERAASICRRIARRSNRLWICVSRCDLGCGCWESRIESLNSSAQAESLAEELGDKRRLAHVFADSCAYFSQAGDHQRAIDAGERALGRLRPKWVIPPSRLMPKSGWPGFIIRLGDYRRAIDLCEQNLSSLKGRPVGERNPFGMQAIVSVGTRHQRGVCLGELGELAQGIGWAQEAVHIAETAGHSHSLTAAYSALSYLHLVKGDLEKALTLLDRSLQICRTAHLDMWLSWPQAQLGYAYAAFTPSAEALPLLEEAAKRPSLGVGIGYHLYWLSEAYLQAGRRDDAIAVGQRALDRRAAVQGTRPRGVGASASGRDLLAS